MRLRPRLPSLLPALLLVLLAMPAGAQTLQLDLYLFEQPRWVQDSDQGRWPFAIPESRDALPPSQAAERAGLEWLSGEQAGFAAAAAQMESQGYRRLYLASFRFPQARQRQAQTWRIAGGERLDIAAADAYADLEGFRGQWQDEIESREPLTLPSLSGWVQTWVDTYLFVELDLALLQADMRRRAEIEQARRERAWQAQADGGPGLRIASNRAAERNGERGGQRGTGDPASYRGSGRDAARAASADARASDGRPETGGYAARDPYAAGGGNTASDFGTADAGWPRGAVQSWRLDRRKRVRLNEIHYLDHPRIGALIRVREL